MHVCKPSRTKRVQGSRRQVSSAALTLLLSSGKKRISFVGTILQNRLEHCPLIIEKKLSKVGRGAFDFKVDTSKNVIIFCLFDSRAVALVSSYVSTEPVASVKRWDEKSNQYVEIPQPHLVAAYNSYIGDIDVHNYLISPYKFHLKSRTWCLYILCHTIMICTVNAWNSHRCYAQLLGEHPKLLRRFIAKV